MNRYAHHKYTWSKPFSYVRHSWELVGPTGGIHFHVADDTAGLEIHYTSPPDYMKGTAPHQTKCWLLNCPCWHDGTSLYATDTLWPMIKSYLKAGDHEKIFKILEREADERFGFTCTEEDAA